MFDRMADL